MVFDYIQLGAGAVTGAVLAGIIAVTVYGPSQRALGAAKAEIKLTAQTDIAIEEIGNDVDKARVKRRLCIERGGVYKLASGECEEAEADQ